MQVREGRIGRVFLLRLDHGEEVVPAIAGLCRREGVAAGWFLLFGAVAKGRLVAGPREAVLPPDPVWLTFPDPHEIVGTGSVALREGEPSVHLHAALGRGREVLSGCLRNEGTAFVVVEALVLELDGIRASRRPDAATGLELLTVE